MRFYRERGQINTFSNCRDLLANRGLSTHTVLYIKDDLESIEKTLRFCFLQGYIIFSFGGIGATPDDLTRLACAKAFGSKIRATSRRN